MGSLGALPLALPALLLWILTTAPTTSARSHNCKSMKSENETIEAPCSELFNMFVQGWSLNQNLYLQRTDKTSKAMPLDCPYYKTTQQVTLGCCEGWDGAQCNIPVCNNCLNGVCTEAIGTPAPTPPYCKCNDGWSGVRCDEDMSLILMSHQYCYHSDSCDGDKTSLTPMAMSSCCSSGFQGSWGSEYFSQCTSCVETQGETNRTQSQDLTTATCMSAGEDIFRTFDQAKFTYYTTCTISMFKISTMQILSQTHCEPYNTCSCKKIVTVIIFENNIQDVYSLVDDDLTVESDSGLVTKFKVTEDKQNFGSNVFVRKDDSKYFYTAKGVSIRVDDSGTLFLSVDRKSLQDSPSGICGNLDGNSENDKANIEELFAKETDTSRPCGNGFQTCDDSLVDEATSACDIVRGSLFSECSNSVDVARIFESCMRSYCSSRATGVEEASLARCNVIEMFVAICFQVEFIIIWWRSAIFCPKTCDNGKTYVPAVMTNCPLTCGMPPTGYFSDACLSDGHAGCVCPVGMAKLNNTCVVPEECQCMGDDRVYYNAGSVIVSSDRCLECTCRKFGLWECVKNAADCRGTCSIIGNTVQTFDDLTYSIHASSCSLTVLQTLDSNTKITMITTNSEYGTSMAGLEIQVNNLTDKLQKGPNGQFFMGKGCRSRLLCMKRVSNNYHSIHLKNDIQILVSENFIFISANLKNMTFRGMCGDGDGNKGNDMMSLTGSYLDNNNFLSVYGQGCVAPAARTLNISTSSPICDRLLTAKYPPTAQANLDTVRSVCQYKTNDADRCQVLIGFALFLKKSFNDLYGNDLNCRRCEERAINICDSNCIDLSFSNCVNDTIYDCTCDQGKYFRDNVCVDKEACGCYDMKTATVVEPYDKQVVGCTECVCQGYKMECHSVCDNVMCTSNQIPYDELKEEGPCARQMCPDKYQVTRKCVEDARPVQQCFCQKGFLQTYNDECVKKCPCYNGETWSDHGYSYKHQCKERVCDDGVWNITNTESCTGTCIVSGTSLKVKPFDSDVLSDQSVNGNCEYVMLQTDSYVLKCKGLMCASTSAICGQMWSIKTPSLQYEIKLSRGMDGSVIYNGQTFTRDLGPGISLYSTGINTVLVLDDNITIVTSNDGSLTQISVKKDSMKDLKGLCGNFDDNSNNDFVGPDNMPLTSFKSAASKWTNDLCGTVDDTPVSQCLVGTGKRRWAQEFCKTITEGQAFSVCRKGFPEYFTLSYYDNCVSSACTCETGGDCGCACDSLAAFHAACSKVFSTRYRRQRTCPIQCENGMEYKECGDACPPTCGDNKTCPNVPCVEGCFCPKGYVRADSVEPGCILKTECPCYVNGRTVSNGAYITINCQQCQCKGGTFDCHGDKCERECDNKYEFKCDNGQCVRKTTRCSGFFDCMDGSDEAGCISTNCTEHTCGNGQCKPWEEVCDGYPDCMDGSDESNCALICDASEFKCLHGCIPRSFVCDHTKDCHNGEDELNCKECPREYTHCNQSLCAPFHAFCDGFDDCGDGSDEVGCTSPTTTTPRPACNKKETVISKPSQDVSVYATSGEPELVFQYDGWLPEDGAGILTMTVSSADGVPPELMTVSVASFNASFIQMGVFLDGVETVSLNEFIANDYNERGFSNEPFDTLKFSTDGLLFVLSVTACMEPSVETTTPAPTTTTSITSTITTTVGPCRQPMFSTVSVTPLNGNQDKVSLVMSSSDSTLSLIVEARHEYLVGEVTEVELEYTNVKFYSIRSRDGDMLRNTTDTDFSSGILTITFADTSTPLPIIIVLNRNFDQGPVTAKAVEVLGCITGTIPTTSVASPEVTTSGYSVSVTTETGLTTPSEFSSQVVSPWSTTPTVTVASSPTVEYTTTPCAYDCVGNCYQTWEDYCQSECADDPICEEPCPYDCEGECYHTHEAFCESSCANGTCVTVRTTTTSTIAMETTTPLITVATSPTGELTPAETTQAAITTAKPISTTTTPSTAFTTLSTTGDFSSVPTLSAHTLFYLSMS